MKTIKRILCVLLLIVMGVIIGYLVFTGKQLSSLQDVNAQIFREVII